jgi:hypothetical protein
MDTLIETPKQRKPRLQPQRSVRVFRGNGHHVLLFTVGHEQTGYYLETIPADFGAGFRLEKFACDGGELYYVNLDPDSGTNSCTCKGHSYRGRCKHVEALAVLRKAGRI